MSETRQCPICERQLKDFEFYEKNYNINIEQCELWWNKPNLKIPCCNCFHKMHVITHNKIDHVNFWDYKGFLNYHSIVFLEANLSMILSPRQYDNLKKWGIL